MCERRHRKGLRNSLCPLKIERGRKQRGRRSSEGRMKLGPICCFIWFFLDSRGRMKRFLFLFLMGRRKKIISFLERQERESPSPSLALVSIVFVSLTSVQDLSFTLFTLSFPAIFLTRSRGKKEIAKLARLLFICWMHNRSAIKNDKLLTCSSRQ